MQHALQSRFTSFDIPKNPFEKGIIGIETSREENNSEQGIEEGAAGGMAAHFKESFGGRQRELLKAKGMFSNAP